MSAKELIQNYFARRAVVVHFLEANLVHINRNTTEEIDFICNCDRWHCAVISGVLKQSKPALFFNSGFQPRFDPDFCTACETCIERCPPEALSMGDNDVPQIDLDRCLGCAVCATGCPTEAIIMEAKADFPAPPKDPKELITALKASFAKQAHQCSVISPTKRVASKCYFKYGEMI